jgi:pre-mRNA-processing factor SLU7
MLQKEYEKKKEQFKSQVQGSILQRYGGDEHLHAPPKSLLLAQTENYVEYSRYGKVIKVRVKLITTVVTEVKFIKSGIYMEII